jgi:hypothetical protein
MPTDKEIARNAHMKKMMTEFQRTYGLDGCLMLCYHHTDDSPHIVTYSVTGVVPSMQEVLMSIGHVIATTAYEVGHAEGKSEAIHVMHTNLNSEKSVT